MKPTLALPSISGILFHYLWSDISFQYYKSSYLIISVEIWFRNIVKNKRDQIRKEQCVNTLKS